MSIDWDDLVLAPVMAVFGEKVIYTPRGNTAVTIEDAVFDQEAVELVIGPDDQQSTVRRPTLGIRAAALPTEARQNDAVRIVRTGETYIVWDAIPDGHGHVLLKLMATT